jgi:peptidoglycan/LPS O-acetylase OafA/YrhL
MVSAGTQAFRFKGIEGLRGWLACIVASCHLVRITGLHLRHPLLNTLIQAADLAVCVFIIISGFVITHLVLTKHERYFAYIIRRFFRIYPVYIVCLAFGIITMRLYIDAIAGEPWGTLSPLTRLSALGIARESYENFVPNLIAHLTMLHGAIPDNVLYGGRFAFLSPAWSLSLEWQFYLVAPLVVYFAGRSVRARVCLAAVAVAGFWACESQLIGVFLQPRSFLFGAALLFAVGIATRFVFHKIHQISQYPVAAVLIGILFLSLSAELIPFYTWVIFVIWMRMDSTTDRVSAAIKKGFDLLLDSRLARQLGNMSYPIYLVHMPVIQLLMYVCISELHMGMFDTCLAVFAAGPLLILIIACAMHVWVEKPFIRFGRSLFLDERATPPGALGDASLKRAV